MINTLSYSVSTKATSIFALKPFRKQCWTVWIKQNI